MEYILSIVSGVEDAGANSVSVSAEPWWLTDSATGYKYIFEIKS